MPKRIPIPNSFKKSVFEFGKRGLPLSFRKHRRRRNAKTALPAMIVIAWKGKVFANNVTFPMMRTETFNSRSVCVLEEGAFTTS